MNLKVYRPNSLTATTATFVVPGQYAWHVQAVRAVLTRGAGGSGTRTPTLTITDGTTTVATAAIVDIAPDPATLNVTWADLAQAIVTAGPGPYIANVSIPVWQLPAGYVITVAIVNPHVGDAINAATAWVDEYPS